MVVVMLAGTVQHVMLDVQGEWGVRCESEEEAEQQRRSEFCRVVLSTLRSQLRILQQSYHVLLLLLLLLMMMLFLLFAMMFLMNNQIHNHSI